MARKSTTVLRQQALKISDMLDTLAANPETPPGIVTAVTAVLDRLDAEIGAKELGPPQ